MASDISSNLERARQLLEQYPSMDLHTHLGYWEGKGLTDIFDVCAFLGDDKLRQNVEQMMNGRCKSAQLCLTGDNPIINLGKPGNKARDFQGDEAWNEYRRQRALINDFCRDLPMAIVHSPEEIDSVFESGKLAVFLTTEGGHMVENDLERLSQLASDGVQRFQPIHYVHTRLGDNQTDASAFGGLSPLGKEAVKEATKQGMVIDAAHASYEAAMDMAKCTSGPLVLSHTMMKYNSACYGSYIENRPGETQPALNTCQAITGVQCRSAVINLLSSKSCNNFSPKPYLTG